MIRDPNGAYKYGRSTVKEGGLLKIKRWQDAEAVIISCLPLLRNQNEAEISELGLTKRSKKKANIVPDFTRLGTLRCCWLDAAKYGEAEFEIGSGYTDKQRLDIMFRKPLSSVVRFKFQDVTKDGKPRFPVFAGFRYVDDIGAVDAELGSGEITPLQKRSN